MAAVRLHKPATTPPEPEPPPSPNVPPDLQAVYLLHMFLDAGLGLCVVPCNDRPEAFYLFDGASDVVAVDSSAVAGLPAEEEYADCWRGVVLADIGENRQEPKVSPSLTNSWRGRCASSATPPCWRRCGRR